MRYYWFKAAPGLYYLYHQIREDGVARIPAGKVARRPDGSYRGTVGLPGFDVTYKRISPDGALRGIERLILTIHPQAFFTRETFK